MKHHRRGLSPLFHVPGGDTVINPFEINMPFQRAIPNPFQFDTPTIDKFQSRPSFQVLMELAKKLYG